MPTILGQNQYGKAENRVVKITRDGDTHHIKDLNVSVALSGDLSDVHLTGSNANCLPTDTTKNTCFAFAKEHGIESAEQYGIELARHFVDSQPSIHRSRIRIEEYSWERIAGSDAGSNFIGADEVQHSFVRKGQEVRLTQITYDGETFEVLSGLKDLTVMNTTNSEFWGYIKDKYTTLKEDYDRILATSLSTWWRHNWTGAEGERTPQWNKSYEQAKKHILQAFVETYSLSLQQTLFQMGSRVINNRSEIDEIRFSAPNKHHFRQDLSAFGLENDAKDGAVYWAADRPYGLIEATILRDGAEQRIPTDMTNL
ncbi:MULTISPECIES: factor-independent urate hydroxylase [unclassified Streptomyces]|uniref:factor-independent urate hydroxylase n=1 Tax=unclassified Streptomyces TaxID=2593676 RepID=UPI000DB9882C|nr:MULTISPECIES: urate oxidase [unclassified Streptomyces]MYT71788.1 urate oxidase [Streptomyces sp. SID8367]RAJ72622.1 urate oxidase [Streptomyces sp. PsTaAH-137]